jgi:protein-S-isoprenylcysteine O-methyltransferase Ste14
MTTELFNTLLAAWSALAVVVFAALFFVTAPYGRHARRGWGPTLRSSWAWVCMEIVAVVGLPVVFILGNHRDAVSALWLVLWEVHYLHRTLVYPYRHRHSSSRTPLTVVLLAVAFNLINVSTNGYWLFVLGPVRDLDWLAEPQCLAGLALFGIGMVLNIDSDNRLLRARRQSDGYTVLRGGGFRWVSSPNYLGEILEWSGFALATASPAAVVFALWTAANLAPRARAHHLWYRQRFTDYPAARRALVPWIW